MLAEASTSTVSSGLPGGGATSRTHVGLSRTSSAIATEAAISAITPPHRARPTAATGRRSAYQPSSATAAAASASHSDAGIRGSNMIAPIIGTLSCGPTS